MGENHEQDNPSDNGQTLPFNGGQFGLGGLGLNSLGEGSIFSLLSMLPRMFSNKSREEILYMLYNIAAIEPKTPIDSELEPPTWEPRPAQQDQGTQEENIKEAVGPAAAFSGIPNLIEIIQVLCYFIVSHDNQLVNYKKSGQLAQRSWERLQEIGDPRGDINNLNEAVGELMSAHRETQRAVAAATGSYRDIIENGAPPPPQFNELPQEDLKPEDIAANQQEEELTQAESNSKKPEPEPEPVKEDEIVKERIERKQIEVQKEEEEKEEEEEKRDEELERQWANRFPYLPRWVVNTKRKKVPKENNI